MRRRKFDGNFVESDNFDGKILFVCGLGSIDDDLWLFLYAIANVDVTHKYNHKKLVKNIMSTSDTFRFDRKNGFWKI